MAGTYKTELLTRLTIPYHNEKITLTKHFFRHLMCINPETYNQLVSRGLSTQIAGTVTNF